MPGVGERLARRPAGHLPDLGRVVLDPAGAREVLLELAVGAPGDPPSSSKTRQVVPVVPWSIARITGRRLSAPGQVGASEVEQLAPAVQEAAEAARRWPGARGRARPRPACTRPGPRRSSSRSPSRSRRRTAARRRSTVGAHRPLAGDRRARRDSRTALDRPAGEADRDPEAAAHPVAKRARPRGRTSRPSTASTRARSSPAEAPRSASQSRNVGGCGSAARPSTASAAAVTLRALAVRPRRATTWAPCASATSAVRSVDASSATTSSAPGNAPARASSVAPIRSASLRAATITTGSPRPFQCARRDILPRRARTWSPPSMNRGPHHRHRLEDRGRAWATRSTRATPS